MEIDVLILGDELGWPQIEAMGRTALSEIGEKKHEMFARIDPRIGRLFLLGNMMVVMLRGGRSPSSEMFVMLWNMMDEVRSMAVGKSDERVTDLCERTEALLVAGLRSIRLQAKLLTPRQPQPNQIN